MKYRVSESIMALAAMTIVGLAVPASAEDESASPAVSFSMTGATEYVWRGVEQSAGQPAIFGAVNVSYGNFYFGAGAENVDFADINTEYDLWAGWTTGLGENTVLDLGVVRYGYIDAPSGLDLDTVELKAGLNHTVGDVSLGATLMITDDFFATEESAQHIEISASKPIAEKWTLSGSFGHQMLDDDTGNYSHWNVGVSRAVSDNISLDFRYIDSDADYLGGAADERLVFSFSVAM